MLTFGTVDGPAPPEHLRCCMARHDSFAQAVTLRWTPSSALRERRQREAQQRLTKHRHGALFNPYDYDEEEDNSGKISDEVEFGSSASEEESEDEEKSITYSSVSDLAEEPLQPGEFVQDRSGGRGGSSEVFGLETTNLHDLEAIETEVARAAARPVPATDHHVVQMRVIRGGGGAGNSTHTHSYEPHGEDGPFTSLAKVSANQNHVDINISKFPDSCVQFRIYAVTAEGIRGDPSVVLSFFTPRVFSHHCQFRDECGPFESSTGLFYQLGTQFGLHSVPQSPSLSALMKALCDVVNFLLSLYIDWCLITSSVYQYRNPHDSGAVVVTAGVKESGKLHSFVSEGHDGDLVVHPPSSFSIFSFVHHDRARGHAWIEVDISAGTSGDREFRLVPDHYCLRSTSGEGGKLRSWVLEGFREWGADSDREPRRDASGGKSGDWVLLREHKQDTSLALTHCSAACWPLNNEEASTKDGGKVGGGKHNSSYRHFRIVNTGNNSCGNR